MCYSFYFGYFFIGDLVCDCYSQIALINTGVMNKFDIDTTEANVEKPCIPAKLTENSDLYDLCTVQGNSDKTWG